MSESKHTKGKWTNMLYADGCGFSIHNEVGRRIACHSNVTIASSPDPEGVKAEIAANMALLTSAPDLLEALEGAVVMLKEAEESGIHLGSALTDARAAIAKATTPRNCETCAHEGKSITEEPCEICGHGRTEWAPKK